MIDEREYYRINEKDIFVVVGFLKRLDDWYNGNAPCSIKNPEVDALLDKWADIIKEEWPAQLAATRRAK